MALAVLILAALGLTMAVQMRAAEQRAQITTEALRSHMEADMMHDTLRAEVYLAFYNSSQGNLAQRARQTTELARYAAWFRRSIAENRNRPLSNPVQHRLRLVERPLREYVVQAETIVTLAYRNPAAARAELDDFTERFDRLERSLEGISNAIEADVHASTAEVDALNVLWRWALVLGTLLGLGAAAGVTALIRTRLVLPVVRISRALEELSRGKLDVAIADAAREDELGTLGKGVEAFKQAVAATRQANERQLAAEREKSEAAEREYRRQQAEFARRRDLEAMANGLEEQVLASAKIILDAVSELQAVSRDMSRNASLTRNDAAAAASATEASARTMQDVAAAAEQLIGSTFEIGGRMKASADATRLMNNRMEAADGLVKQLTGAAAEIDTVSAFISSVANRTNMLALNATIEAARAGEAGRGFAVVANEVKTLARQTREATSEINSKIDEVRTIAKAVASSIKRMSEETGRLDETAVMVASAVDQQNQATSSIGRSVQETATRVDSLQRIVSGVRDQADVTEDVAGGVDRSARMLEEHIERLASNVNDFIREVRAA
jgi:methyl-accepting chemotaxis protein